MMKCAEKFGQKPEIQHEIINICDTTPVRPLFDGIARDCFEVCLSFNINLFIQLILGQWKFVVDFECAILDLLSDLFYYQHVWLLAQLRYHDQESIWQCKFLFTQLLTYQLIRFCLAPICFVRLLLNAPVDFHL